MVQHCCVVNCSNRASKNNTFTFHSCSPSLNSYTERKTSMCVVYRDLENMTHYRFPFRDADRLAVWIARISRKNPDGSDWYPKPKDKVCTCSAHFVEFDYMKGYSRRELNSDAVPSVFPYPKHKQVNLTRRKLAKKRHLCEPFISFEPQSKKMKLSASLPEDHVDNFPTAEADLGITEQKLDLSVKKQQMQAAELNMVKKQIQRRDKRLECLLKELKQQNILKNEHYDILDQNFDAETRTVIEKDLMHLKCSPNFHVYSEDLKSFAVSLHFYSALAYDYVRKHLLLPHSNTSSMIS